MGIYILKRFISNVIVLWLVITMAFFAVRIMPEGPFNNSNMSAQSQENLEIFYGFNRHVIEQYFIYIKNLLERNFGISMLGSGYEVTEIILNTFQVSITVGIMTLIISSVFGTTIGTIILLYDDEFIVKVLKLIVSFGNIIPSFVIAAILIYILEIRWNLLPLTGFNSPLHYAILVIILGLSCTSFLSRLVRISLTEIENEDYMYAARAKGMPYNTIVIKHGLKNSLISITKYLPCLTTLLFANMLAAERIFNINGFAREFAQASINSDYTMLLGLITSLSIFLVVFNFIIDILYAVINPYVKF